LFLDFDPSAGDVYTGGANPDEARMTVSGGVGKAGMLYRNSLASPRLEGRVTQGATWLVRIVFVAAVLRAGWNVDAADLTASYLAGRMVENGDLAALYRPIIAAAHWSADPVWARYVADAGLPAGTITPFVQTPLWAWLIGPLSDAVNFGVFKRIFAAISAIMTVTMVACAARQWAPRLSDPGWQAGLLAGLFCSTPFLAGIALGQTHAIFLCFAVLAAIRAVQGKEISAGALLAAAAAVKVTPLWLAVTWLAAGRWRAAVSFAAFSAVLAALAVLCAGWPVVSAYLATLHAVGARMTLAFNNDALAALLLGRQVTDATAFQWQLVTLPPWIAGLSLALLAACAVLGGWLDRRALRKPGAALTLVAATAFAPLAWNHYFIVLILPVMIFLESSQESGRSGWAILTMLVAALNFPPLAYSEGAKLAVVALRSHLLAALLCLAALPMAATGSGIRQRYWTVDRKAERDLDS
jgi:hypothetical protein